jgi:hypothetical protein
MNTSIRTLLLPLLLAGAALSATPAQAISRTHAADYYGTLDIGAAPGAGRLVRIDEHTRWVNVTDGDTVRFEVGGKRFTFTFDAWNSVNSVELSAIAPAGVTVPKVRVYIAQNPLYVG